MKKKKQHDARGLLGLRVAASRACKTGSAWRTHRASASRAAGWSAQHSCFGNTPGVGKQPSNVRSGRDASARRRGFQKIPCSPPPMAAAQAGIRIPAAKVAAAHDTGPAAGPAAPTSSLPAKAHCRAAPYDAACSVEACGGSGVPRPGVCSREGGVLIPADAVACASDLARPLLRAPVVVI